LIDRSGLKRRCNLPIDLSRIQCRSKTQWHKSGSKNTLTYECHK